MQIKLVELENKEIAEKGQDKKRNIFTTRVKENNGNKNLIARKMNLITHLVPICFLFF